MLAACAESAPFVDPVADNPHGYVEGAAELTEPQLTLATIDAAGQLALTDLVDEARVEVASLDRVTDAATDGRFVFATDAAGVTIVDSGVWTVDHEDHSHYYRAEPAVVGTVAGAGPAAVAGGGAITAITFAGGESVLLDSAALAAGSVVEVDRLSADLVVPFGEKTLVAAAGTVTVLGEPGAKIACPDPRGTIATRVGVVVGCRDGAILATSVSETVDFEAVPYPAGTDVSDRALEFRARPGRPTVAAVAGSSGYWLLDTRERSWVRVSTDETLLRVAAADDAEGNVIALASDGSIVTLDGETGDTIAATAPVLADTVADPALLAGVELTVDANRAYVNGPAEGAIFEIDYADDARVARTLEIPGSPVFFAETGRVS